LKSLTQHDKERLNGKMAHLARKGEFSRTAFVEVVRGLLPGKIAGPTG
jgi:hypothetical protein